MKRTVINVIILLSLSIFAGTAVATFSDLATTPFLTNRLSTVDQIFVPSDSEVLNCTPDPCPDPNGNNSNPNP